MAESYWILPNITPLQSCVFQSKELYLMNLLRKNISKEKGETHNYLGVCTVKFIGPSALMKRLLSLPFDLVGVVANKARVAESQLGEVVDELRLGWAVERVR